jgi:hypothetical protein
LETAMGGLVAEDGAFVKEEVPTVGVRGIMVEAEEDDSRLSRLLGRVCRGSRTSSGRAECGGTNAMAQGS